MSGSLIDTNVIVKLMNGDQKTIQIFETLDDINISAITAGELLYGAKKSSRSMENLSLFHKFLSEYTVLTVDKEVSNSYADIKLQLVKKGVNIPENDLWIAAIAINSDLTLFTYDKHFDSIEGLKRLL
jgi:tRNA(fMet)-specific endonuclease VapC